MPDEAVNSAYLQARALRQQGDLAGAVDLVSHTLDAAGLTLGPDDPEVLGLAGLLAGLHRDAGELTSARRVLEEALADGYHSPGPAHPVMVRLAADLGAVADALGNKHEARRNYSLVAQYGPAVLGPDDPALRAATRYLHAGAPPIPTQPGPPPAAIRRPPPAEPGPPPAPPLLTPEPVDPTEGSGPPPIDLRPSPESPGVYVVEPETGYAPAPEASYEPSLFAQPGMREPSFQPDYRGVAGSPWVEDDEDEQELAPYRNRRPLLIFGILVAIGVIVAAVVVVVMFLRAESDPPVSPPSGTATASSPSVGEPGAPTGLSLRDNAGSVTLTWGDPSGGKASFIVLGGLASGSPRAFATLPTGQSAYTVNGLNPQAEYCFRVAAVYSVDQLIPSGSVCTTRAKPSGSPSPKVTS